MSSVAEKSNHGIEQTAPQVCQQVTMFRPRRGYGHQSRGPGIALFLLAYQMLQVGFDKIPPTTLITILGQVAIFLRPNVLRFRWPSIGDVCISAVKVWYKEDWTRLLTAAFFHADEWHLYYNMISFLWKGLTLERRMGTGYFACLIGVFAILCNITTIGLGVLAEAAFHDSSYLSQCAVGFSGVIFALKVITTYMLPPGMHYIMGLIPVPSRYAVWAELALIQVLVPNASFVGHLAGILVGLAYVKGPLKPLMDSVIPSGPSYTYRAGQSGYRPSARAGQAPSQGSRYDRYTGGFSEEEQYRQAVRESRRQNERLYPSAPPDPDPDPNPPHTATSNGAHGPHPDLSSRTYDQEEVRRRRLARFQ